MRGILIGSQEGDWEALFIDGKLIDQGHSLGEGTPAKFWLDIAHDHKLRATDLYSCEVDDEDEEQLQQYGLFPQEFNVEKYITDDN